MTLENAVASIRAGTLSPIDLTAAHLERIQQLDGYLNCFITVTAESATGAAAAAEVAVRAGQPLGQLHGAPVALKDLYDTAGTLTTAGSTFFAQRVPDTDAVTLSRLRVAGAVNLGKLNMHEWALGVTNDNPHFGPCRNPWDPERITGGSSGGSAAALAAGFCLGSLGSDTGGSIRIPAALCGVVGLKPTFGRVSLRGVVPLSWNLDHAGPMARRVADAALLLQVIAAYDSADPFCVDRPVEDYTVSLRGGVEGLTIGLAGPASVAGCDDEVLEAVYEAGALFRALGAYVRDVELPRLSEAASANGVMTTADAAAFHQERLQQHPDGFGTDVLARLRRGAAWTSGQYAAARHTQALLRREFESWFSNVDAVILPTTPVPAPLLAGLDAVETARLLTRFTAPFNLTGLPALSLPCGLTRAGLPVGLQIVGPPWSEALVLRVGHAYEGATHWHEAGPDLSKRSTPVA